MFKRKQRGRKRNMRRRGKGIRPNRSKLGLNPAVQNKNYATITETREIASAMEANTPYFQQTAISQYPRALAVAACFKFYRLKAVVYDYSPDANTYQAGPAAAGTTQAETIPFMYYIMNRDASSTSFSTLQQYQNCGARPIKFTKKIVIAYKPNLLKANQLVGIFQGQTNPSLYNGQNTPVYDEWISTSGLQHPQAPSWTGTHEPLPTATQGTGANPIESPYMVNTLPYYGHCVWFDQNVTPAGASSVGFFTTTAIWEFKEPVLYPAGVTQE